MIIQPNEPEGNIDSLTGAIGWFNHNSLQLIDEYRRLEERVQYLKAQLQAKNQELERSLQEREHSRAYLLSVLESLKGGVLVLDQDLRPTFLNRRMIELIGPVSEERVAQILGDKLAASLRSREKPALPFECEKVVQGSGGTMTPVHLSLSEVHFARGRSHCVLVFQDITTVKKLEAEAARTRRLASLGVMAAEVAHQVKNPLGGIELCASLLKERATGDPKRLAEEILRAVQRLSTTLSHMLAFAAEPVIAADNLPLPILMKDLIEESMPVFDDARWSIIFEIEPNLPPVRGDRGLLVQALLNLIVNAKEAMPAGGRVVVKAQASPCANLNGQIHRAIEIIVADGGSGISQENRERIFDPFFTTKEQGTGLGLALTHKIVTAHSGSIEIDSIPEAGSQFIMRLPAGEEI